MNKFTVGLLGLVIGFAVACGAQANTGTDNLGKVKDGTVDQFAFASTKPPSSFMDSVNFELESLSALVSDSYVTSGTKNLSVSLYNDTSNALVFDCTSSCASAESFSDLTKGDDYSLIFTGTTVGPSGSNSYLYGDIAVTSAVPEPDVAVLGLSGLALLGVFALRRRDLGHLHLTFVST